MRSILPRVIGIVEVYFRTKSEGVIEFELNRGRGMFKYI